MLGRDRPRSYTANGRSFTLPADIFESGTASGRRRVIFRDSAGGFPLPFLANDFERLVSAASESIFHDLSRSERPDIGIAQITEHNIRAPSPTGLDRPAVPGDPPPYSFPDQTGAALPLVPHAAAAVWHGGRMMSVFAVPPARLGTRDRGCQSLFLFLGDTC